MLKELSVPARVEKTQLELCLRWFVSLEKALESNCLLKCEDVKAGSAQRGKLLLSKGTSVVVI